MSDLRRRWSPSPFYGEGRTQGLKAEGLGEVQG